MTVTLDTPPAPTPTPTPLPERLIIGVLALQGAFMEHMHYLEW
jgi:hypothetical protein